MTIDYTKIGSKELIDMAYHAAVEVENYRKVIEAIAAEINSREAKKAK